jgi:hypothetical protein
MIISNPLPCSSSGETYTDSAYPLGRIYEASLAPPEVAVMERQKRTPANLKGGDIFKRKEQACYYDSGLGCSGNYCWKACGSPGDGTYCPNNTFKRTFADCGD